MKSLFWPRKIPVPTRLDVHRPLMRSLDRRGLIRGGLSLGAMTMLTGCDFDTPEFVETALRKVSVLNDSVQAYIFNPNKLAPTYPLSKVLKPPRFNAYYDIMDVRPVDGSSWRLELSGLIDKKTSWTIEQIAALPQQEEIIRLVCVEGWDYIGQWSGVPLRAFLDYIGADKRARYVVFRTVDDYLSSIDMATALHPQTLLVTKYAGDTLPLPFGYPMRLLTSTKLGFKNPKWITAIEVTNNFMPSFWEKAGFNWFSGI